MSDQSLWVCLHKCLATVAVIDNGGGGDGGGGDVRAAGLAPDGDDVISMSGIGRGCQNIEMVIIASW